MSGEKVPELTSDDLLTGDEEEIRGKIETVIEKRISEVGKLPPERQSAMDEAMKGLAIFADDDEDIREYAKSLLGKEVSKLAAEAGADDVKAAAERVSKRLAVLMVAKSQPGAEVGVEGPIQTGGGSAAAAHTTDAPPKNIAEAEAYADKIAAAFSLKR
jgi:hypothetical protein